MYIYLHIYIYTYTYVYNFHGTGTSPTQVPSLVDRSGPERVLSVQIGAGFDRENPETTRYS